MENYLDEFQTLILEASYITLYTICYDLDSMLSKRHTLVLSNIRELDRELHTEISTLYTKLR